MYYTFYLYIDANIRHHTLSLKLTPLIVQIRYKSADFVKVMQILKVWTLKFKGHILIIIFVKSAFLFPDLDDVIMPSFRLYKLSMAKHIIAWRPAAGATVGAPNLGGIFW